MTTQDGPTRMSPTSKCPDDSPLRNLVVCIDGTSNQFGSKNTNIVEFYSHITKNDRQLTYYSSGLGTTAKVAGASLRRVLSSDLDMAIGRNLHKVIMASYRWLCDNYQDKDRVFLFGYSRGAYQVRALAGMISRVGLLLPGNNEQIPFAFELYSKTTEDDVGLARPASVMSQSSIKESKQKTRYSELAKTFQKTFCRGDVHIHFVGAWDTVSSVGFGRGKTLPCTTTSCEHICYFRHALALDERRVKFLPEYVYGGRSSSSNNGRIKEVWFAGSHADVGGGNRRNDRLQSGDIPLLWMRSQAITAGLTMNPGDVMWKIDDLNKRITPSLTAMWWLLELLPFRRLLYYNSDRRTIRPHVGGPRRILPGQKVHVSVLFKNNYKPHARFYGNPESWPEPMFWNDENSHRRLQGLSDTWEKDIFDKDSVQTLLDALRPGRLNLDALDRLGFMASFDVCKDVIRDNQNAKQTLGNLLNSNDRLIRLSTVVIYCELGWVQDWHMGTTHVDLGAQITADMTALLRSDEDCRRACIYLPSLCKWTDVKPGLVTDENLKTLVRLCDKTRVGKHEEATSAIAFHSAQALSMLIKVDAGLGQRLIDIQRVSDMTEALRSNCNPALVSVLSVLNEVAKHQNGRDSMKVGLTVTRLIKLVKHFDDFVASAATEVLCSLCQEDDLRQIMVFQFNVLSLFLEMLDRCSSETKQVACQALVTFAGYEDVRSALSQQGYLESLAKRVQSHTPSKRDGAISALVQLSETQVRAAVTKAIATTKTIRILVGRLNQKAAALPTASVLARLVKMEDVAVMVSDNGSGACVGIVNMLQQRWFDGECGEDGLQVLSELLECERLWSGVLEADAIGVLSQMIHSEHYENMYAGLHYLRVVARFVDDDSRPLPRETLRLVPYLVSALQSPHRRVQQIAMEILRALFAAGAPESNRSSEDLRTPIVQGVLNLLKERQARVVLAASTLLSCLAADKSLRDKVVVDEAFLSLGPRYYNGLLDLEYDDKGKPRAGELHASIRRLIKLMQASESDETEADAEGSRAGTMERDRDGLFVAMGPLLYEPRKEERSRTVYRIATLLCCPPLLLSAAGQRMYRELWQEG